MTAAARAELAAAVRAAAARTHAELTVRMESVHPLMLGPLALLLVLAAGLIAFAAVVLVATAGTLFAALVAVLMVRRGVHAATTYTPKPKPQPEPEKTGEIA